MVVRSRCRGMAWSCATVQGSRPPKRMCMRVCFLPHYKQHHFVESYKNILHFVSNMFVYVPFLIPLEPLVCYCDTLDSKRQNFSKFAGIVWPYTLIDHLLDSLRSVYAPKHTLDPAKNMAVMPSPKHCPEVSAMKTEYLIDDFHLLPKNCKLSEIQVSSWNANSRSVMKPDELQISWCSFSFMS